MPAITIVPKKGSTLPVGECELVKETSDAYIVKAVAKTGKGRGTKTVLRQYVLPKTEVAFLYQENEISSEEAAKYPVAGGKATSTRAAASVEAAPVKRGRGRPKKTEATAEAAPVKRGRGRPKKTDVTAEAVEAAPVKRGRGRPKKTDVTAEAAPVKRGRGRPKKTDVTAEAAPVKRGRGRPKKTDAAPDGGNGVQKRRPGRPPKSASPVENNEAAAADSALPADPPAQKVSLFTDFGG